MRKMRKIYCNFSFIYYISWMGGVGQANAYIGLQGETGGGGPKMP